MNYGKPEWKDVINYFAQEVASLAITHVVKIDRAGYGVKNGVFKLTLSLTDPSGVTDTVQVRTEDHKYGFGVDDNDDLVSFLVNRDFARVVAAELSSARISFVKSNLL